MNVGSRRLVVYFGVLFAIAILLSLSAARPKPAAHPVIPRSTRAAVPDLTGHWAGTWEDTVFSVSGSLVFNFTNMTTGTGQIDLSSLGLGVQFGNAMGTIVNDTLAFSFISASVGSGGGVIVGDSAQGGGSVGAPLNYGPFVFEGRITASTIDGRFYYIFPGGGGGKASLGKTSPVETQTWGRVKAIYSGDER